MPRVSFTSQVLAEKAASAKKLKQKSEPVSVATAPLALTVESPPRPSVLPALQLLSDQPSPKLSASDVFAQNDTTGAVAAILRPTSLTPPSRAMQSIHGLRRPFRASFGFAGQLVIPHSDGTVEIRSLPQAAKSNSAQGTELQSLLLTHAEKTIPEETRLETYIKVSDSRQNQAVFGFLNAAYGRSKSGKNMEDFPNRALRCQNDLRQERVNEVDDWLRDALQNTASKQEFGILCGDAKQEINTKLSTKTRGSLRAATLAAQGPGLDAEAYHCVVETAKSTTGTHSEIGRVCQALSGKPGYRARWSTMYSSFERQWIRAFANEFYNRENPLDPLNAVLETYVRNRSTVPADGMFHLLQFTATYPCPDSIRTFQQAMMRLRSHVFDWSLPWHVAEFFLKARLSCLSKRDRALLTMSYCYQLEQMKMIEWAVYVCFKGLPEDTEEDQVRRRKAVYELLTKHWRSYFERNERARLFLSETIGIPEEYLHHARAMCSTDEQVRIEGFRKCREWTELAIVVGKRHGPLVVVSRDASRLQLLVDIRNHLDMNRSSVHNPAQWPLSKTQQWAIMLGTFARLLQLNQQAGADSRTFTSELERLFLLLTPPKTTEALSFPVESVCRVAIEDMARWVANKIPIRQSPQAQLLLERMLRMPLSSQDRLELLARNVDVLVQHIQ